MEEGIKSDMEIHPEIVLRVSIPLTQVFFIILRSLFFPYGSVSATSISMYSNDEGDRKLPKGSVRHR